MPNLQRGGPCLNFAHFTMQFCNPSDPKGGAMAQCPPPLNTPLLLVSVSSRIPAMKHVPLLHHKPDQFNGLALSSTLLPNIFSRFSLVAILAIFNVNKKFFFIIEILLKV